MNDEPKPDDAPALARWLRDVRPDAVISTLGQLAALLKETGTRIPRYCRRILVEGRWRDGMSLPPKVVRPGKSRSRG